MHDLDTCCSSPGSGIVMLLVFVKTIDIDYGIVQQMCF